MITSVAVCSSHADVPVLGVGVCNPDSPIQVIMSNVICKRGNKECGCDGLGGVCWFRLAILLNDASDSCPFSSDQQIDMRIATGA